MARTNPKPSEVSPFTAAGDLAFTGMDMRAPSLVPEGFVSSARNLRVVDGVYQSRYGLFSPTWTRYASDDFPYRASYLRDDSAAWASAYATTYGAAVFSDPSTTGSTWLVRVCAQALLFFRETEVGRIVPFSSGLAVSGPVQVFQNFNTLVICRGGTQSSLVWSGSFDAVVTELVPSSIVSGYAAMPPSPYGLAWRERSVLLVDRDNLILSRIADSTQYHTTNGIFYVNRGRGDVLRAAVPLGVSSLLVLKSQSLHVFGATKADLSDARIDSQAAELQFDSPRTAVAADGKVWWLDRRGVRTAEISQIDVDNKLVLTIDSTLSDRIQPLIRRIAWKYADQFSAVVTTDRIYFAVALDTQTTPQTLLVWNRLLSQWESYDQWDTATLGGFAVQAFAPNVPWLETPRLCGVSATGQIAVLEYGLGEDHVGWSGTTPVRAAISALLISRGYTAGTSDPKQFARAQFQLDTWNPGTVGLSAIYDGPGETDALAGAARNRLNYFNTAADFVGYNADGRFHDPKRQDFSVALGAALPPASGAATWTVGQTYTLGQMVYRATNGRNYEARAGTTAEASTAPDINPLLWVYVRPDDDLGGSAYYDYLLNSSGTQITNAAGDPIRMSHAVPWAVGTAYTAGTSVGYAGSIYTALARSTGALGNEPELNPSLWLDRGLDTALATAGLYLHDGVRLDDFQATADRRELRREAAWCQLSLTATQGAFKLRSLTLEVQPGRESNLTHA